MAIKVFETAAILMLAVAWMCCALDVPVVQIKNGTLQGLVMKSRTGREFHGFLGIPYALPPVGELRFQVIFISNSKFYFYFKSAVIF